MLAHAGWVLLMVQMIPDEPVLLLSEKECGPALHSNSDSVFAGVDFTLEYPVPLLSFSLQLEDFSVKLGSCISNPPLMCHIWAQSSLGRPLCVIHLKAYSLYEICHFCVSVSLWRANARPQSHFLRLQPHLHLRLSRYSKCGLTWEEVDGD